jgi:hypothetical protein
MSNTSIRRLALSGHQLSPLCGPDNLTGRLAEAKPIRQARPSPLTEDGRGLEQPRLFFLPLCTRVRGIGILRTSPFGHSRKMR